jgi:multidrug transporter EmrE-like cation transporter
MSHSDLLAILGAILFLVGVIALGLANGRMRMGIAGASLTGLGALVGLAAIIAWYM